MSDSWLKISTNFLWTTARTLGPSQWVVCMCAASWRACTSPASFHRGRKICWMIICWMIICWMIIVTMSPQSACKRRCHGLYHGSSYTSASYSTHHACQCKGRVWERTMFQGKPFGAIKPWFISHYRKTSSLSIWQDSTWWILHLRYGGNRSPRGANLSNLIRSSTLTTRPTVYIRLVPKVPITWSETLWDLRGLLRAGSIPSVSQMQNSSQHVTSQHVTSQHVTSQSVTSQHFHKHDDLTKLKLNANQVECEWTNHFLLDHCLHAILN